MKINNSNIIKISGGLGNQLFQYALGKNLALKNGSDLKLDISWYDSVDSNYRDFKIDNYKTNFTIAQKLEMDKFRKSNIVTKIIKKIFGSNCRKEKNFNFDSKILNLSKPAYLIGYWQSEKYFSNITDVIRKELVLKNDPSIETKEWIKKISNSNAVSLHIRRGDYINNTKTNQTHGTCSLDYYKEAITYISQKITKPVFFIFSDDIEWAKKNLQIAFPIFFVSDNKIPDYEELIIMSNCKHNIIANSSFSWWGAWLNNNPEKTIIAPKKWFKAEHLNTNDLIPNSWIKL